MVNEQDPTIRVGGLSSSGTNLAAKKDPLVGTLFADRYRILDVLGRGGMGVVYKARHEHLDRLVAIKMMLPQLVSDETSMARFQREARAASRINHPNIIAIHDFGTTSDTGIAYLVMDYLEGQSLSQAIKKDGQLGVARTAAIFLQVCDALEHAHKLGVIHRDLKPGNIMLVKTEDTDDFVKVVDFGVAKLSASENETDQQRLTGTGEIIFGSPVYMSPEQCSGMTLDARSDVYALGCVLYETLTGKLPCVGRNAIETITKHLNSYPPPFSEARPDLFIPEWMERIVFRALEKDPERRQQSMAELFNELALGTGMNSSSSQIRALSSSMRTRLNSATHIPTVQESSARASLRTQAVAPQADTHKFQIMGFALVGLIVMIVAGALAFTWLSSQQHVTPPAVPTPVTTTPPADHKPSTTTAAADSQQPAQSQPRATARAVQPPAATAQPPQQSAQPAVTAQEKKPHSRTVVAPLLTDNPVPPLLKKSPRPIKTVVETILHKRTHGGHTDAVEDTAEPVRPHRIRNDNDWDSYTERHEGGSGKASDLPINFPGN